MSLSKINGIRTGSDDKKITAGILIKYYCIGKIGLRGTLHQIGFLYNTTAAVRSSSMRNGFADFKKPGRSFVNNFICSGIIEQSI